MVDSRQISKGMGNLIKYVRYSISRIPPDTNEAEAKSILLEKMQTFLEERVIFAGESIARYATAAIKDGDVVLTYGSSPLIRKVLLTACKSRSFRLVIIDSRPLNEGLSTLSALSHQIPCVYSPLSGAAAAMKNHAVSVVLLGSSSLLSNGALLAPAGTAMVASIARARQIPVIVAAESYKFSEKVQLDSIVYNELGESSEIAVMQEPDPNSSGSNSGSSGGAGGGKGRASGGSVNSSTAFLPTPQLQPGYRGAEASRKVRSGSFGESDASSAAFTAGGGTGGGSGVEAGQPPPLPFSVVNLRYDLTPISNISVVATEAGLIPPTSIPVLMREILSDLAISGPSSAAAAGAAVVAAAAAASVAASGASTAAAAVQR